MGDRVGGRLYLSVGWRVTPLDVITMQIRSLQAEVNVKQETVATLEERFQATPEPPPIVLHT